MRPKTRQVRIQPRNLDTGQTYEVKMGGRVFQIRGREEVMEVLRIKDRLKGNREAERKKRGP